MNAVLPSLLNADVGAAAADGQSLHFLERLRIETWAIVSLPL
jgi:hypothetical protein